MKNWQWTALGVVGTIVVIIGVVAIWNFYPRSPSIEPASIEPERMSAVPDMKEAPKTIAVLPFADLSPEKDQEYFVDGLSEEILNSLAGLPDLNVIGRTSSFSFKGSNKTIQEIASVLGVDHILEGSVRKEGSALRITAQLVRASDGVHLWSEAYDRELKDIFSVQEDIATKVAEQLKVTLGISKSPKQLAGTDNLEAYELYLMAVGQFYSLKYDQALETIDEVLALDPEFADAWAAKGGILVDYITFEPRIRANLERHAALSAAQKAIELEPNLANGYVTLGYVASMSGNWIDAELNFRKALQLRAETQGHSSMAISNFYRAVGYFKKSRGILEELRRIEPLDESFRRNHVITLGLLRDMKGVENENERGKALFGDLWKAHSWGMTYYRLGTGNPVSRDEIVHTIPISDGIKEYLDSPKQALIKLHQLYSDENTLSERDITDISILAAYFGDPDFAMEAMEKGIKINALGLFKIWYPVMKDVRQLPRFKELMREIGLVDYWEEFGWPDLCRPRGDDDFVCD